MLYIELMNLRGILPTVFASMFLVACGTSSGGDGDPGTLDPGDVSNASCVRATGLPDVIVPGDLQAVDTEGTTGRWGYQYDYSTGHTIEEYEHLLALLDADGWQTFTGRDELFEGWEGLNALAIKGNQLLTIVTTGDNPFTLEGDYSGFMYLVYGQFPHDIEETLLPALFLPDDAVILGSFWSAVSHDFSLTFATNLDRPAYQAEFEALVASEGLDLSLAYDQAVALTYFSSDQSMAANISTLEINIGEEDPFALGSNITLNLDDRTCLDVIPGNDGV